MTEKGMDVVDRTALDTDVIQREIEVRAPRSKVWRALTDWREFSRWFGVEIHDPFVPGATVRGRVVDPPGYEHIVFEMQIESMQPERHFSWRWHPYAIDPQRDYSQEPTTLVEFELSEVAAGTRIQVRESGLDRIPIDRRADVLRMNTQGWDEQMQNIARHVDAAV